MKQWVYRHIPTCALAFRLSLFAIKETRNRRVGLVSTQCVRPRVCHRRSGRAVLVAVRPGCGDWSASLRTAPGTSPRWGRAPRSRGTERVREGVQDRDPVVRWAEPLHRRLLREDADEAAGCTGRQAHEMVLAILLLAHAQPRLSFLCHNDLGLEVTSVVVSW